MNADAHTELRRRARELNAARDYPALVALLDPLEPAVLEGEPELGYLLAEALRRVGAGARALDLLRRIEPACRRRGNDRLYRDRINLEGVLLFEHGDVDGAVRVWGELLDAASRGGDEEFVARANNNLGVVATLRGRNREALASYQRAIAAYQRLGHRRGLAQAHQNLAITFRELGFGREADAHFRRAISYARADGSRDEVARSEQERALLFLELRRDARLADAQARRALEGFARLGDPGGEGESLRVLGIIALAERRLDAARDHLERALDLARSLHHRLLEAESLEALAAVDAAADREDAAAVRRAEAETLFAGLGAAGWGARFRKRLERIAGAPAAAPLDDEPPAGAADGAADGVSPPPAG